MKIPVDDNYRKWQIKYELMDLPLSKKIQFYKMAIKYWMGGDDWLFAQEYALSLIKGFQNIAK